MTVYVDFDPTLLADGTTMASLGWTQFPAVKSDGTVQGGEFTVSTTLGSTTVTVTAVTSGALVAGNSTNGYQVQGAGIPVNTRLSAYGTGAGGTGTYTMSNAATATASGVTMLAGPYWRISAGALISNNYGGPAIYPRIAYNVGAPIIRGQAYITRLPSTGSGSAYRCTILQKDSNSFVYVQGAVFTGAGGGYAINFIAWQDGAASANTSFTASTTNGSTSISVTALGTGPIYFGRPLTGAGIPTGAYIVSQSSGTAKGIGVYVISVAATATASGVAVTTKAQFNYRINFNAGTQIKVFPSIAFVQWVVVGTNLNFYLNGTLLTVTDVVSGATMTDIPIPVWLQGAQMGGFYPPQGSISFATPFRLRDNATLLVITDVSAVRYDQTTSKLRINFTSSTAGSPDVNIVVRDNMGNSLFSGTAPVVAGAGTLDTGQIPKGLESTVLSISADDGVTSALIYYDMPFTVTLQPFKLGNNNSQATYFSGFCPWVDVAKMIRYRTAGATSLPGSATIASFGTGTGGVGTYVMSTPATVTMTGVLATIGTNRYYVNITNASTTMTVTSVIDGGTIATGQAILNQSNDFILSSWMDPTTFVYEGWAPPSYVGMQSNGSPTKFPDDTTDTIRTNLCWYTTPGNIIWDMRQAPNLTWAFSGTLTDWNVDLNYYGTNIHRIRVTSDFIPNLRLDFSRNGTANQGMPTTAWSMSMLYEGTNLATQPWKQEYVDYWLESGASHIRYMTDQAANEIGAPNGGLPFDLYTAANRIKLTNQNWLAYGAEADTPVEAVVLLHNTVRKNIWHTISRACDETYVREIVSLYRDGLDSSLQVTFEVSNETWNYNFPQSFAYKVDGMKRGIARLGSGGEAVASITSGDNTLTITSFSSGSITLPIPTSGIVVSGTGIPAGTKIAAVGTGTGGVGTYVMDTPATATASGVTVWMGNSATSAANFTANTTSGNRLITATAVAIGTITGGQPIAGAGIPPGAVISVTNATANITSSSTTLTVSAINSGVSGTIAAGMPITGTGIPAGTTIASLGTGTGGVGTYVLSAAATATTTGVAVVVGVGTGVGGTGTYYLSTPATATASGVAMHSGPAIFGAANGNYAFPADWVNTTTYPIDAVAYVPINASAFGSAWRCYVPITNAIATGQTVSGTGIPAGRTIASLGTGTGGAGTYTMSGNATATSSATTLTIGAVAGAGGSPGMTFRVATTSGSAVITVLGHVSPESDTTHWTLWQDGRSATRRSHAEHIAQVRGWIADEWGDDSRWNMVAGTWDAGWDQDVGDYLTWGRLAQQINAIAPAPYFGNDTFDYATAPASVQTAVLTMTGAPRIAAFQAAAQDAANVVLDRFVDHDRDLGVRLRALGLTDTDVQIWAYEGGWSFNCKMSNATLATNGVGPIDQTAFHDDWFAFKSDRMYDIYVSFFGSLRDLTGGWITHFHSIGPPYPGVLTTNYGPTWYVSESMSDRSATSSAYHALADIGGGPSPPIVAPRLLPSAVMS